MLRFTKELRRVTQNNLWQSNYRFIPIPGIWRFHLIYLVIISLMALSVFPFYLYVSLLIISGICVFGLLLSYFKRLLATQVLALAVGLGSPIVVFAVLLPAQTIILFLFLILGGTITRRALFYL